MSDEQTHTVMVALRWRQSMTRQRILDAYQLASLALALCVKREPAEQTEVRFLRAIHIALNAMNRFLRELDAAQNLNAPVIAQMAMEAAENHRVITEELDGHRRLIEAHRVDGPKVTTLRSTWRNRKLN